jgi:hypothetical protein
MVSDPRAAKLPERMRSASFFCEPSDQVGDALGSSGTTAALRCQDSWTVPGRSFTSRRASFLAPKSVPKSRPENGYVFDTVARTPHAFGIFRFRKAVRKLIPPFLVSGKAIAVALASLTGRPFAASLLRGNHAAKGRWDHVARFSCQQVLWPRSFWRAHD